MMLARLPSHDGNAAIRACWVRYGGSAKEHLPARRWCASQSLGRVLDAIERAGESGLLSVEAIDREIYGNMRTDRRESRRRA